MTFVARENYLVFVLGRGHREGYITLEVISSFVRHCSNDLQSYNARNKTSFTAMPKSRLSIAPNIIVLDQWATMSCLTCCGAYHLWQ